MPIPWARTVTRWLSQNYAWLLILSCLLLFTTQTLFNFPIAVMAVIGLYRLWRAPTKYWQDRGVRVLLGLFLCLWLPMLFSLVDAVEAGRATSQSLTYLRFFFAGVFALDTLRDHTARRRLFMGTSIFVAFWCVDAMIQLAFGRDLFSYPYNGSQLNGLFHPKLRLGLLTATFFPILLEVARQSAYRWWWVGAAVIPALAAILLSGNRNAWFMLAVAAAGYLLFLRTIQRGLSWIRISSFAAVILGLVLVAALQYPPFQSRVQTTL